MSWLDRISEGWRAWPVLFFLTFAAAAPGVFGLPALDRDESRFAQASKQMLETGDYIRLRYQDEYRNKKPAGIHWLQAGATAVLGDETPTEIWTYRVPSWIGAALSSMAVFWCGLALLGRRAAFLGAALYASTLLVTSEAHISKTDAVLVLLVAVAAGALARLHMRGEPDKRLALLFWGAMGASFLIKGPVAPMVAAYAGAGAYVWGRLSGSVPANGAGHWRVLLWWPGPAIFIAMVLPWFAWIQWATAGEYIQGAVGKDLKDKFAGASEGHAGWPLYHITHLPAWFFPGTLLLAPAAVLTWRQLVGARDDIAREAVMVLFAGGGMVALVAFLFPGEIANGAPSALAGLLVVLFWAIGRGGRWRSERADRVRVAAAAPEDGRRALEFLSAWGLLTLIFFELMPTRLSHYILPAYPAFALLCGWAAAQMAEGARVPVSRAVSGVLFAIGAGALLALTHPASWRALARAEIGELGGSTERVVALWQGATDFPMTLWWLALLASLAALALWGWRRIGAAAAAAVLAASLAGWHARSNVLSAVDWVQPTVIARAALGEVCGVPGQAGCAGRAPPRSVQAVGYSEPSYVMTLGTENLHPPETVVGVSPDTPLPAVYLLNTLGREGGAAALSRLEGDAARLGLCTDRSEPRYALNYSNGQAVRFVAWRADRCR